MIRLAAFLLLLCPGIAEAFTEAERRLILDHGPWPPPLKADASNAASGDPAAIRLGALLFEDRNLSSGRALACADCHRPGRAFADGQATAAGKSPLPRNTPSLWNVRFQRWFGWGGASDTLWGASIRPILAAEEMGATTDHVAATISKDATLDAAYRAAFETGDVLVNVGKALAAYQETLVTAPSAFDQFRDALAADDAAGIAAYPEAARRGLRLFIGEGRCALCHSGPLFTHGEFEDAGVPYFIRPGAVDAGRHAGLKAFRASAFTAAGAHSDAPESDAARLTESARSQHRDFGAFRVPSLRGAASTAPYMHDGSLPTLEAVVRHYSEIDMERLHSDGASILRPLKLSDAQVADLVAFLETL